MFLYHLQNNMRHRFLVVLNLLGLKLLPVPQNSLQASKLQNFLVGKR
ncbi:MAG: hypothetical protein RL082_1574 [Pseudomonadota bacterium]